MESCKVIALIALLVISVTESAQNSCPTKYARFSDHHSFCNLRNPNCSIIKEGVDVNARNSILQAHNNFRSQVATGKESQAGGLPPASNMLQMEWDEELASVAQKWALQCKFEHDCNQCRQVENFSVGQNLAYEEQWGCSSESCLEEAVKPNWGSVVKLFYDEVSLFNKNYIKPFHYQSGYGHFSQVVWANSWRVGCGYVVHKRGKNIRRLYACNYGPAGNFGGQSMYQEGKTCSACPTNTCCGCRAQGPTYPGLCKIQDLSVGPVHETKNALLDCNWRNQSSPCKVTVEGKKDWKVKPSFGGAYTTITLNGGEKSVLKLPTLIQPKAQPFCVRVHFREGPSDAAQKDSGIYNLVLRIPDWNWSTTMPLQINSKKFVSYPITLNWNAKTEISLELSVPPSAPAHIFDLRELIATDGKCA